MSHQDFKDYRKTADAPNILRLHADGSLSCADGSDPKERLKEFFKLVHTPAEEEVGMPVCMMHLDGYAALAADAFLAANMCA